MSGSLDQILVDGILCDASVGIHSQERSARQPLEVSFAVRLPVFQVSQPDHSESIVFDYSDFIPRVKALVESRHFDLIETVANAVAGLLLSSPAVHSVDVSVLKRPDGLPQNSGVVFRCTRSRSDFGGR